MSKRRIKFELDKSDVKTILEALKERSEKVMEDVETMDELIRLNSSHRTEEETQRSRGVRDRKAREYDRCQGLIATIRAEARL